MKHFKTENDCLEFIKSEIVDTLTDNLNSAMGENFGLYSPDERAEMRDKLADIQSIIDRVGLITYFSDTEKSSKPTHKCGKCGSTNIGFDAYLDFNGDVISGPFDSGSACMDCGDNLNVELVEADG